MLKTIIRWMYLRTFRRYTSQAVITDRSELTPWMPMPQVGDRISCTLPEGATVPDGWTVGTNEDGDQYAWKYVTEPRRTLGDVMNEQNLRREW